MEDLKKALGTIINVAEKSELAMQDGKISIAEGVGIAMSSIGFIGIVKNAKDLFNEYTALSEEEKVELYDWFELEFDLVNDSSEDVVEGVFSVLLNLNDLWNSVI